MLTQLASNKNNETAKNLKIAQWRRKKKRAFVISEDTEMMWVSYQNGLGLAN